MFYGDSTQDTRQFFFSSWQKYKEQRPLSSLEKQIVAVILDHPEYHMLLESSLALEQPYSTENGQHNPFLHMGLHLAIRDQIAMDRPAGMKKIHQKLLKKHVDIMVVEHMVMEYFAEYLWQMQRVNNAKDAANHEKNYIISLKRLVNML